MFLSVDSGGFGESDTRGVSGLTKRMVFCRSAGRIKKLLGSIFNFQQKHVKEIK